MQGRSTGMQEKESTVQSRKQAGHGRLHRLRRAKEAGVPIGSGRAALGDPSSCSVFALILTYYRLLSDVLAYSRLIGKNFSLVLSKATWKYGAAFALSYGAPRTDRWRFKVI